MRRDRIKIYDIISLLLIMLAAVCTMNESLLSIGLFIVIPTAFLCCAIFYDTIRNNTYIRILLCLYLWLCVCYPFSEYIEPANAELRRILGCFILSYSVATLATKSKLIPWLYVVYFLLLIFAWKYAYENVLQEITFGEDRLSDDQLNANHMAYYTFYTTIGVYILGDIVSNKPIKSVFKVLFWGTLVLSFITAIYTASRQVLYIQIPLFISLITLRYFINNKRSLFIKLPMLISVVAMALMLYNKHGEEIYSNSLLKERAATSYTEDERSSIAKECIQLGLNRPFFGYGPGNAMFHTSEHVFAHNTFLELFVNSGLVGMIIFAHLIIVYLKTQYIRWQKSRDNLFLTFFIIGLFWLLYQFLYVFYIDLWLISFFIFLSTHSNTYYQQKLIVK